MVAVKHYSFNPYVTIGISHPYYLDEYILVFRCIRGDLPFLFHFDDIPVSKEHSHRCNTAFFGVTSGAILFANVP